MVACGECPHHFLGARDVNVVADEDVFGSPHARFHFEEALPDFSTELFRSVTESLAPVHFGGDDIPMIRALKRTPHGSDRESGLTEHMHNLRRVWNAPSGVILFHGFTSDRNRQNRILPEGHGGRAINRFGRGTSSPWIAGIFTHRPFRCHLGSRNITLDYDFCCRWHFQINGLALCDLDGLAKIRAHEIALVEYSRKGIPPTKGMKGSAPSTRAKGMSLPKSVHCWRTIPMCWFGAMIPAMRFLSSTMIRAMDQLHHFLSGVSTTTIPNVFR